MQGGSIPCNGGVWRQEEVAALFSERDDSVVMAHFGGGA